MSNGQKYLAPIRAAFVVILLTLGHPAVAANASKASLQAVTQQYQQATAALIASAQAFYSKMNAVEQNGTIDELAFEGRPIDNAAIDQNPIITAQQLKVRADAMKALSAYTVDLAALASGSSLKTFGQNLQDLNKNLNKIATDAGSLPEVSAGSVLKDKAFPGIVSGAAQAIGAIVALIEGRRAQKEVREKILADDKAMTVITTTIGEEIGLAYERQRDKDSARESQLTTIYNNKLKDQNVFLRVLLAQQIEASRAERTALARANPASAVAAMEQAHVSMVQYVASGKRAADISALVASVGSFFSAAQSSQSNAAPAK